MSIAPPEPELVLGFEHAGLRMTPEEFDAITEYDENYRYELIDGVLVVSPSPLPEETDPNEELGHWLRNYQEGHRRGSALDWTLPQQYVYTATGRRLADRLIWTGLGRMPDRRRDVPSIAVEFVSGGRRNRRRDYVDKRQEYREAGIQEYWIIDRFQRTLTVIRNTPEGSDERVIPANRTYRTPLLPGFKLPQAELLAIADRCAEQEQTEE
jgi:Uma2 family endonuclease